MEAPAEEAGAAGGGGGGGGAGAIAIADGCKPPVGAMTGDGWLAHVRGADVPRLLAVLRGRIGLPSRGDYDRAAQEMVAGPPPIDSGIPMAVWQRSIADATDDFMRIQLLAAFERVCEMFRDRDDPVALLRRVAGCGMDGGSVVAMVHGVFVLSPYYLLFHTGMPMSELVARADEVADHLLLDDDERAFWSQDAHAYLAPQIGWLKVHRPSMFDSSDPDNLCVLTEGLPSRDWNWKENAAPERRDRSDFLPAHLSSSPPDGTRRRTRTRTRSRRRGRKASVPIPK